MIKSSGLNWLLAYFVQILKTSTGFCHDLCKYMTMLLFFNVILFRLFFPVLAIQIFLKNI